MSYSENLYIFLSNLSYLYIVSVLISLIFFVGFLYVTIVNNVHKIQPKSSKKLNKNSDGELDDDDDGQMDDNGELTPTKNLIGRLKTARLKVLEESLTEEQKITEKEIERQQLAAIFELLKQQEEEQAQPISLNPEELRAQLNLYR